MSITEMETYEAAADENAFSAPLSNIQLDLDGTEAIIDLIPSLILGTAAEICPDVNPMTNNILISGRSVVEVQLSDRPILEAKRFMRAHFYGIRAIVIQEEFVEIIDVLDSSLKGAPRISGSKAPYPFLRVKNSKWKQDLPEYQGGDNSDLTHFKIVSMTTHIDVLGFLEKIKWLDRD